MQNNDGALRPKKINKLEAKQILAVSNGVAPKTKTHIYHEIVKSAITYAAETWCLKAKTVTKLNSNEMDFLATLGSNFQEGQN